jgi:hypothetical protein
MFRQIGSQLSYLDMDNFSLEEERCVDLGQLTGLCPRLEQLHLSMLHCSYSTPNSGPHQSLGCTDINDVCMSVR